MSIKLLTRVPRQGSSAPALDRECYGGRASDKIADSDFFVGLVGLGGIARAEVDGRRLTKACRQADVAMGAEARQGG